MYEDPCGAALPDDIRLGNGSAAGVGNVGGGSGGGGEGTSEGGSESSSIAGSVSAARVQKRANAGAQPKKKLTTQ